MIRPTISFEFYPPGTDRARGQLMEAAQRLAALGPAFMTVTYGAGGSTRQWTQETAIAIQQGTGVSTAAHLTCVNTFKDGIRDIADNLWAGGIHHIVALRGDVPQADMPLDYSDYNYYHYANELVSGLKSRHDFEISVAAYPEKHPEAPDMNTDIANLKRKCEAGAARAITQFFFDNDSYFRFCDKAAAAGITTPIVPGILPIADFEKMLAFAARCQARVPAWLHEKFRGQTPARQAEAAHEVLTAQCRALIAGGAPHIHFYTLNRAEAVVRACQEAGLAV